MRKKLISYEALNRIEKDSLSNAATELAEAENVLGRLIDTPVKLHCYDRNNVIYKSLADDSFVRADFSVSEGKVKLENIEKLVIDEESITETGKTMLADMLEALVNDNEPKATTMLRKYLEAHRPKMAYKMGRRKKSPTEKMVSNMKKLEHCGCEDKDDDEGEEEDEKKFKRPEKTPEFDAAKGEVEYAKKMKKKMKAKSYKEWHRVAKNVIEYVNENTLRPSLRESQVKRNASGDVTTVEMPTKQLRAEGKVLTLKYDGLKTDLKVIREHGLRLSSDRNFQKAVSEMKKLNNISDNNALEESIYNLINNYPSVLYTTEQELTKNISKALEMVGESNFDDNTCKFMAEGILRTAYESYPERVNKIFSLANTRLPESTQDAYLDFQSVVKDFYPSIDENFAVEMQVFSDLYHIFQDIRESAVNVGHEAVRNDASKYLGRLEAVLEGHEKPTLSLAEQAAWYAGLLAESEWEIVKNPYVSINGDNPQMAKLASTGYTPSKDFDPWKDAAPALDDKGGKYNTGGAKEMRAKSWGQEGGKDIYPTLSNPYTPKGMDWTMKGDKGVDKDGDSSSGQWQSGDTYPALENPYLPKSTKFLVNDPDRVDDNGVA